MPLPLEISRRNSLLAIKTGAGVGLLACATSGSIRVPALVEGWFTVFKGWTSLQILSGVTVTEAIGAAGLEHSASVLTQIHRRSTSTTNFAIQD